ncbi:MAG: Hsp33 family molecular chaperone HslO [Legionellaceae bacterium]|nr:Hsp33 family molecular chaperone HslO [Legionellaceae bacterium]
MTKQDILRPFLLEQYQIRGQLIYLNNTLQTIVNQRAYPPFIRQLLGEALLTSIMLTSSLKFEGRLNVQFQGDEPLSLLLAQCDHSLGVRGLVQFAETATQEDYAQAFLKGTMVCTITHNKDPQSYQSMIPIYSTSLAENVMQYFKQSDQINSYVFLGVENDRAFGLLLQAMPSTNPEEQAAFWEEAVAVLATLNPQETWSISPETLLQRLYPEQNIRIFDEKPLRFQCRCNAERMQQLVCSLGKAEAEALLQKNQVIDVTCDFCNTSYTFSKDEVAHFFH